MASILILNANIVNEGLISQGDVYINNHRIEKIGSNLSHYQADQIIDAAGRFLMPGMIDSHVHFREPGLTYKGTLASESRASIAGGITSVLDMPNTVPYVLTEEDIIGKKALAQGQCWTNYAFYLGASNNNLETIKALHPNLACGIKILTGSSQHNQVVDDPDRLALIFQHAPILVAMHCEDMPTILENEESYRSIYGDTIPMELHPLIRSEDACYKSSSMVVGLARSLKTRLHVLQLSTAKELELFDVGSSTDKRITADTCTHYLQFSSEDYALRGALLKCDPAIKTSADRAALIQGLLEGRIDSISSGHAPHTLSEKNEPSYFNIPSGFPSTQHALPSLLEGFHEGLFSLEHIVDKTSHTVAQLFQIQERGFIREGYWADLILVDISKPWIAEHSNSYYHCGWTAHFGMEFRSTIDATIVNGTLVWYEGAFMPTVAPGTALEFTRS
ncbi:dihydroorotase [Thiofilum flexile]|uniref:dihydroorotase n=1 Tax=Thiofilum flexile TaxID=125627 RepID=UPI0003639ED0|nr:dihydroorotase [Thiofilum flexile]